MKPTWRRSSAKKPRRIADRRERTKLRDLVRTIESRHAA
jgi:hypothetical protein